MRAALRSASLQAAQCQGSVSAFLDRFETNLRAVDGNGEAVRVALVRARAKEDAQQHKRRRADSAVSACVIGVERPIRSRSPTCRAGTGPPVPSATCVSRDRGVLGIEDVL